MAFRVFLIGLVALCTLASGERRPVAEFLGKRSINGRIAENEPELDGSNSFVSAPNSHNGLHSWTVSMPAPQQMLSKRAGEPLPRRYGPLLSNCVFCPEPEMLQEDGLTLVHRLNAKKMKTYMRGMPADLNNKCVFYTRGEDRTKALSAPATDWACLYNKYSIWHLWPNKRIASQDPEKVKDFYGIYEKDSWLYKIVELPRPRTRASYPTRYFQAMSQAMTESCSGEVVILTERLETLHEQYSILQPGKSEFENI